MDTSGPGPSEPVPLSFFGPTAAAPVTRTSGAAVHPGNSSQNQKPDSDAERVEVSPCWLLVEQQQNHVTLVFAVQLPQVPPASTEPGIHCVLSPFNWSETLLLFTVEHQRLGRFSGMTDQ